MIMADICKIDPLLLGKKETWELAQKFLSQEYSLRELMDMDRTLYWDKVRTYHKKLLCGEIITD
jgi:hypothetical protein